MPSRTLRPPAPSSRRTALAGWRARAWAWVLFAALLKGLVPPVAVAAAVMHGDPAALFCQPGAVAGTAGADGQGAAAKVAHLPCVCASAGDGALAPAAGPAPFAARPAGVLTCAAQAAAPLAAARLRPPVRGPPAAG